MCSVICACLVLLLLRFSLELTKFAKISVHARDNVGIALADGTGLAIYCDFDLIAIGSRETIAIYNYTLDANNQGIIGSLVDSVRLRNPISQSGYIEFKLLTRTQLFYCDSSSCSLCNMIGRNTSCTPLLISWNGGVSSSMLGVSAARCSGKLFIRVVELNRAAVLSFSPSNSRLLEPEQSASDAPYMSNFSTVLAFSRAKYCYFVGSTLQPYEPLINANLGIENRTNAKIIRVCSSDATPELESRMDLAIDCGFAGLTEQDVTEKHQRVEAASYDSRRDRLTVVVASSSRSSSRRVVCVYSMVEVDKRFDHDWTICQKTTLRSGGQDCESAAKEEYLQDHCHIFTRRTDAFRMQTCTRFGQDVQRVYENCNLHEYFGRSYRYGWLEDFRPFNGISVANVDTDLENIISVIPDELHGALFLAGYGRGSTILLRVPWLLEQQTSLSPILWSGESFPQSRFSVSLDRSGDAVFILNGTVVAVMYITCSDLYKTCEELSQGGWMDPLSCVWCADEQRQVMVTLDDELPCTSPITRVCPPTVYHANRNDNHSEWEIFGSNFDRMENAEVFVCEEKCAINRQLSDNSKLLCILPNGSSQFPGCGVRIVGQLGEYKDFTLFVKKTTHSVASMTEQSQHGKSSRAWKIVLALIVVFVILTVLGVIICLARKKIMESRKNADVVSATFPLGDTLGIGRHVSKYDACSMDYTSPYEQLFRDIDDRLKIDASRLQFEAEIGRGHFGIVSRATYTAPDGTKKKVACKVLKQSVDGVGDFILEGLTMHRFDHPHLMPLIGLTLTEGKIPVIVADFMENGDLRTYLRDDSKIITLRSLLRFAQQIAEGMNHLHICRSVHCDLAARNCMLSADLTIRIGDFGLCRRISDESDAYEPSHKHRDVPFPWMAPEAIVTEKFTFQNDVWAYGVVLWELTTRGLTPYNGKKNLEILDFLRSNKRLEMPEYCPTQLYKQIMLPCWHADPNCRPNFSRIVSLVNTLITSMENSQSQQLNRNYEKLSSLRTNDSSATETSGLTTLS